jgi:hypothetical protein
MTQSNEMTQRIGRLLESTAVFDLQSLFRLDPFYNGKDGMRDLGWCCRDQSVLLAALLSTERFKARVVHGSTVFVQGPTSGGEMAIGLGDPNAENISHTWIEVADFGIIDISPRLDETLDGVFSYWRPLPTRAGLIGTEWVAVQHLSSDVALVTNRSDYLRAFDRGLKKRDSATAVYWPREKEAFKMGMLNTDYVVSPLTDRLDAWRIDGSHPSLACDQEQRERHRYSDEKPAQHV